MNEKKHIVLIKLGGSIITDKEKPSTLRKEVLERLIHEIARARKEIKANIIIGHGQGSYAHIPATKYQTMHGFQNNDSVYGMAVVQDVAAQPNRLVVAECIRQNLPAVTCAASNTIITAERKESHFFLEILERYLQNGLIPVTYGDVLVDDKKGCTIWSTEEILSFYAEQLLQRGYIIDQVIHVVEVDGVYDMDKRVIPIIREDDWEMIQTNIQKTKGLDVTGGMGLKIRESLDLAKRGVQSKIVSGLKPNNVYNVLVGKTWEGTAIV